MQLELALVLIEPLIFHIGGGGRKYPQYHIPLIRKGGTLEQLH